MIIIGVDPGFDRLGVAILEKKETGDELIYSSCVVSSKKQVHEKRLAFIFKEFGKILKKYRPDVVAIEKLFLFKNHKTVMGVAEARGVILCLAGINNVKIEEYSPLNVKMSVTGYGRAEKKQVESMVRTILKLEKTPDLDDEIDAIAVALTASASLRNKISTDTRNSLDK